LRAEIIAVTISTLQYNSDNKHGNYCTRACISSFLAATTFCQAFRTSRHH